MKFLSLCSGIDAASVASAPLGWECVGFSEIEPFPCAVLAHRYPNVQNFGDMTKYAEWPEQVFIDADAIVGGPPCQAFSMAGKREGLDDARGNLTLIYANLIDHADRIRSAHGKSPVWCLYENVPGLLSDRTNAFGCLLGILAGENVPLLPTGGKWTNAGFVSGPSRSIAWRVLDAQYFGVAQRRRRVFVVAGSGDFDPAKVLFESEGVRRDSAPSREAGKGIATVAGTLSANGGGTTRPAGNCNELDFCVASWNLGPDGVARNDGISPTLDTRCADGPRRNQGGLIIVDPIVCAAHGQANAETRTEVTDVAGTLSANGGGTTRPAGNCNELDFCVATYGCQGIGAYEESNLSATLLKTGQDLGNGYEAIVAHGIGVDCYNGTITGDMAATFGANSGGTNNAGQKVLDHVPTCFKVRCGCEGGGKGYLGQEDAAFTLATGADKHLFHQMAVRRLTPVECERLQGFPDGLTAIPYKGKPASECPDGPRYKALGNSWAVPCARWIFEKLRKEYQQP